MLKKFFAKVASLFSGSAARTSSPFCKQDANGDYWAYVNDQGGARKIAGPYGSCKDCQDNTGATTCV